MDKIIEVIAYGRNSDKAQTTSQDIQDDAFTHFAANAFATLFGGKAKIVENYKDHGKSASKKRQLHKRHDFHRMLDDVRAATESSPETRDEKCLSGSRLWSLGSGLSTLESQTVQTDRRVRLLAAQERWELFVEPMLVGIKTGIVGHDSQDVLEAMGIEQSDSDRLFNFTMVRPSVVRETLLSYNAEVKLWFSEKKQSSRATGGRKSWEVDMGRLEARIGSLQLTPNNPLAGQPRRLAPLRRSVERFCEAALNGLHQPAHLPAQALQYAALGEQYGIDR